MTIPEAIEEICSELKRYNVPQDFWKKQHNNTKIVDYVQARHYLRYSLITHYGFTPHKIVQCCPKVAMFKDERQFFNSKYYVLKHKEFREKFEL
jgi:hypothetical protein